MGFPGAGGLLRRLAATGAPIGIVSGALRDEILLGLDLLEARSAVRFIVASEDTQASKPNPAGYLIGKRQLILSAGPEVADAALVIEDSVAGIKAALAAGFFCLAVAHSYDRRHLLAAGAVDVVDRIADASDDYLRQLAVKVGVQ